MKKNPLELLQKILEGLRHVWRPEVGGYSQAQEPENSVGGWWGLLYVFRVAVCLWVKLFLDC